MKENANIALQMLEQVIFNLAERGMHSDIDMLSICHQSLIDFIQFSEAEALENTAETTFPLVTHPDIVTLNSYLSRDGIKERFPNLEEKAISIAIGSITKIPVEIKSFVKSAEEILKDVNDEVILQLLEF
jgi:hypothetical protein